MLKQVRTGIIGAAGFTGRELIEIINSHPNLSLVYATSGEFAGKAIGECFGELDLARTGDIRFSAHPKTDEEIPELDLVFLAVPDQAAMELTPRLLNLGVRVIDISGSFRLKETAAFQRYYGLDHSAAELLPNAIYGMSEIYREKIKEAALVANPGCYATSAILPLFYLRDITGACDCKYIVDAKSGTSGAGGRAEKDSLPYSKVNENFRAYKAKAHQHIPEIAQETAPFFEKAPSVRMTPQLLPLFRGILSAIYLFPKSPVDMAQILEKARGRASGERFIRIYDDLESIELRRVQRTNFLDMAVHYDESTQILVVLSAIDNLRKGAAGQAIQNANLMFGLPETSGLL